MSQDEQKGVLQYGEDFMQQVTLGGGHGGDYEGGGDGGDYDGGDYDGGDYDGGDGGDYGGGGGDYGGGGGGDYDGNWDDCDDVNDGSPSSMRVMHIYLYRHPRRHQMGF